MESIAAEKLSSILSADALGAAFKAQSELFERFITMARSPDEPAVIKVMLRKTIDISIALTGADRGSLILLDSDGDVADSILSRGEISPELKSVLIESAFKKGLAGWVKHHGKVGLVHDTKKDDRWLTFPDQPYRARSALALPVISGEVLLGILTLKHSRPYHFTQEIVELMRVTATQVAMVLENACLFTNLNNSLQSLGKANQKIEAYSQALDQEIEKCRQIQMNFLPRQLPRLPDWHIEEFFFRPGASPAISLEVFPSLTRFATWISAGVSFINLLDKVRAKGEMIASRLDSTISKKVFSRFPKFTIFNFSRYGKMSSFTLPAIFSSSSNLSSSLFFSALRNNSVLYEIQIDMD